MRRIDVCHNPQQRRMSPSSMRLPMHELRRLELAQESLASICPTITGAKMLPGQASQTLLKGRREFHRMSPLGHER